MRDKIYKLGLSCLNSTNFHDQRTVTEIEGERERESRKEKKIEGKKKIKTRARVCAPAARFRFSLTNNKGPLPASFNNALVFVPPLYTYM